MIYLRRATNLFNTPFLRWYAGIAIGLAILHLILFLSWGRGYIPIVLPGFAVVMDSVITIAALAVAFLSFGRYYVVRDPTSFWGGVAFASLALFALFEILTAPGTLPSGRSILGHLPGTSSWFWHLMFSSLGFFLIVETLVMWPRPGTIGEHWWPWLAVAGGLVSVILGWLLIVFDSSLPPLVINGQVTALNRLWDIAILALFAVGTVLSVDCFLKTREVPIAGLALCQLVLTYAMITDLIGTQIYDVWWYWRRVLIVGAFSTILFGSLLDYVQLYLRERDRIRELLVLQSVGTVLMHEVELPRVAKVIVNESIRVLRVDAAEIWLADPDRRELTLLASRGHSSTFVQTNRRLPFEAPRLAALAARTEQMQAVDDVCLSDVRELDRQAYLRENFRSLISVPLCTRDHLVGVATFARRHPGGFTSEQLAFIIPTAGLFAVAIENSRLYAEVRQVLRLREEFMAAAAHELRSPVTVIQGRAELVLKRDALDESARAGIETVLRAAKRIDRLVYDLLAVLRVRPGSIALHRERLDLGALTKSAVEQVIQTTENYQFDVDVDELLIVDVDQLLVCEVLSRLLENAIRFMPGGGRIRVEARRRDGDAVVAVTHHGIEIRPERRPFVFEPFFEPVPGGNPGYSGIVSLGLHLSKQIIESHGGRIELVSTQDGGTTFSFRLPLALDAL